MKENTKPNQKEVRQNQFMLVVQRMGYLAKRINAEEDATEEMNAVLFELGILSAQLGIEEILEGNQRSGRSE